MNNKITKLEELNEELNAILISNPDLIFIIGADEVYQNVYTHRPQDLFIPKEQFIGMKMQETLPPYVYNQIKTPFYRALETNELEIVKYEIDF